MGNQRSTTERTGSIIMLTALITAGLAPLASHPAQAAPVLGGQLYATGGALTVEVMPATAGYTSELWLYAPSSFFVATNRDIGLVVTLPPIPAGAELVFGIFVRNTGITYYMGPASRNPDGISHARVDDLGGGVAIVGFEDLYGGGDRDYDDNVFRFTGVTPEPDPNEPPVADAGLDLALSADASCMATATLDGSASSDPDGDALTYAWSGPFGALTGAVVTATFGLGVSTATLAVDDGNGGSDTDTALVTVSDDSPPALTASADVTTLWPPNHKMRPIVLTVAASDNCDPGAAGGARITSITSDEHVDGLGDGSTEPDWEITGPLIAKLRAERSGLGDGRVYTLTVETTDASGNVATTTVAVAVPHSR